MAVSYTHLQAVATFYPEAVKTPYGEVKSIKDWGVDVEFAGMDCLAVRSDVPQEIVDKLNACLLYTSASSAKRGQLVRNIDLLSVNDCENTLNADVFSVA